jgi:hypothetical protein
VTGKLTIVGPEPSGDDNFSTPARVNIEALMLMAKYDGAFRELLFSDRAKALEQSGISFSQSEKLMLSVLPLDKLRSGIEEFNINGINSESLPSWKETAAVLMLVMSVIIGGACAGTQLDPSWIVHGEKKSGNCDIREVKEGWCDIDTFRVRATGVPSKKAKDPEDRKKSSRMAAVLNAQYYVLEKFKGAKLEGATGIMDTDFSGISVAKEIISYVKAGTIIAEKYDEEQNCEIVYEVRAKNLKKKLQDANWH